MYFFQLCKTTYLLPAIVGTIRACQRHLANHNREQLHRMLKEATSPDVHARILALIEGLAWEEQSIDGYLRPWDDSLSLSLSLSFSLSLSSVLGRILVFHCFLETKEEKKKNERKKKEREKKEREKIKKGKDKKERKREKRIEKKKGQKEIGSPTHIRGCVLGSQLGAPPHARRSKALAPSAPRDVRAGSPREWGGQKKRQQNRTTCPCMSVVYSIHIVTVEAADQNCNWEGRFFLGKKRRRCAGGAMI